MTFVRGALPAVLDALPWAVLVAGGTYVLVGDTEALPGLLVAALVGLVLLTMLGTISANVARERDRRFHVTRWVVATAVWFWP